LGGAGALIADQATQLGQQTANSGSVWRGATEGKAQLQSGAAPWLTVGILGENFNIFRLRIGQAMGARLGRDGNG
jgi:hypothetical protein